MQHSALPFQSSSSWTPPFTVSNSLFDTLFTLAYSNLTELTIYLLFTFLRSSIMREKKIKYKLAVLAIYISALTANQFISKICTILTPHQELTCHTRLLTDLGTILQTALLIAQYLII